MPKYPVAIRVLHWLMAVIIIGLIAVGLFMTGLTRDDPHRALLFGLHKSFGVTILLLVVLRFGLRLRLGVPPLPEIIPAIERKLALLGHWGFYAFMIALPLSGYLMTNSFGLMVAWFGVPLPKLFDVDKARGHLAADFHQLAAYTLIGLITLHVLAVIKHYARDRVNLLTRMTLP